MMERQQQRTQTKGDSMLSIFFSILLIIIIFVIIGIQIAILVYYAQQNGKGRCIYLNSSEDGETNDTTDCNCKTTNEKSCKSLHGIFQTNLTCQDGYLYPCQFLNKTKNNT